jgi:hypothetical protein
MVFARRPPDGTPLETILRVELHIHKKSPAAIAYTAEVLVHRNGEAEAISVPIPFDPAWDRIPTELRREFIKTGKDIVVRLLFTVGA